jgi:hypothetical protein
MRQKASAGFGLCVDRLPVAYHWGTFVQFHEQIVTSLDRMTQVLVMEQVVVQRDWFASFRLLEWIVEVLERTSPQQVGVDLMEGLTIEVVPVVVADVEWV